jgi:hypothetical protein
MAKFAIPLSLTALVGLGACATDSNYPSNPPPVVSANGAPVASGSGAGVISGYSGSVSGSPVLMAPAGSTIKEGTVFTPSSATPFRAGSGTVESIVLVQILPAGSTASAGASIPPESIAYRLTMKMDDGSYQAVDQTNRNFMVGDRVQLTPDGRVTRQ